MKRVDDDFPPEFPDLPSEPPEAFVVSLAITAPSGREPVPGPWQGVRLAIQGTAAVESGTGLIDRVEVSLGDRPAVPATATAAAWSRWERFEDVTAEGTFTVLARAIDGSGQVVAERSTQVTVDLDPKPVDPPPPPPPPVPPTVSIDAPVAGSVVALVDGKQAQIDIAGRAWDAHANHRVELTLDGAPVDVQPVGDGQWRATATVLGAGRHEVRARVVDAAGLDAAASVELTALVAPPAPPVVERLLIVEKCQLSTYAGAMGPGPVIKTISLVPGQKETLTLKTWRRLEDKTSTASSILDNLDESSKTSFEQTLAAEQSRKQVGEESLQWGVSAEAGATWGWGSASVNGSLSGSSNAAREELAKSMSNAVTKHAAEASSKRQIEAKASHEMKREEGEEYSSETKIENINLSRTLTYICQQVNQEYLTFFSIVDVGIAYVRGDLEPDPEHPGESRIRWSYNEVNLSQLDPLLRAVIVPDRVADVRRMVLTALGNVFDYEDERHSLYERRDLVDEDGRPSGSYLRFPKGKTSTYVDPATGVELVVPGVILAAMRNIMRTDGVVCDAVLGKGVALDDYSQGLQTNAVEARRLENERALAAIRKEDAALRLVETHDAEGARVFAEVFREPEADSLALVTTNVAGQNGAKA
jgi:hypothetical protein